VRASCRTYGDQLAFQLNPRCDLRVGECALEHLDCIRPTEQRRMSLRELRRQLRPTGLVRGDRQRLLQQPARAFPAGELLRARRLAQYVDTHLRGRRLGERALEQVGGGGGRAAVDRGPRRRAQAFDHPRVGGAAQRPQVRGDLARRRSLRVENTSGRAMRGVLLGAGQRLADRVPDDRMYEAGRSVVTEDFEPHQLRREVCRPIHRDVRDCGRVAKLAAVAQDRQRLRQAQRGRVEALEPRSQLQRHGVDCAETDHVLERAQRTTRISGSFQGAQEFPQVERISPGGAMCQRADMVVRAASERVANDGRHGLPAQQGRANRRRRRRAHGDQRLRSGRGLVGTQCRDERDAWAVEARRQVGEPAHRRRVGPVRVVDGQQDGGMVGEVDRQPVESVEDGEGGILLPAARVVASKERDDRPRRAREQPVSFVRTRVGAATFEELSGDPEGEIAFEIGSAGPQHDALLPPRARAGGVEHRGLADAGTAFDHQDAAASDGGFDRRQLGVAFDEVGHAPTDRQRTLSRLPKGLKAAARRD
jgi:hypothetical protein